MGEAMRGGAQKGGSYESDKAELNLDIKQRGRCEGGGTWAWDVRKERCPDSISSTPMGIPRMLQQCGNRLHPITPEALYPQSALVSKTDNLTVLNLFKGLLGFLESLEGWEIINFRVFGILRVEQKRVYSVKYLFNL